MNSVKLSNTFVAEYSSRPSVPPYPGKSTATKMLDSWIAGEDTIWRHTAQLSGKPWIRMTSGFFERAAVALPGTTLVR